MTKKYIKTGTTPVFTGELEKLRGHWDTFVEYKSSELGLQKVQKTKDNASKQVYHHTLGQGGYKLAIPKWEKMKQDLLDRGIKWTYELGKSLVPPEVVFVLPTQMYKLHQHYMRAMADCIFMQGANIKDDDFLWGRSLYG